MTNKEAIEQLKNYHYENGTVPQEIILAIKALEERPQGKWIKIGEIGLAYKCDKCDEVSVIPENFCPNCGADMRGKEE